MAPQLRATTTEARITTRKRRMREDVASPSPKRLKAPSSKATKSVPKPVPRNKRIQTPKDILNAAPTTRLEIFAFGEGSAGELGLGTKKAIDVKRPRLNPNLDAKSVGVVDIATGGMHAVALTHDNKVLTWGVNDLCTLGRDTTWEGGMRDVDAEEDSDSDASDSGLNPRESTPTTIPADKFPAGTKIVQVAAGDSTTFVLTDEGLVYGWGTFRNNNGIFGFSLRQGNTIIRVQKEPMLIPNLKRITQLSVGNDFCLALDAEGNVFSWGNGEESQLGHRILGRRRAAALIPARVALPKKNKIVSIHAGSNHAFAIDSNGDTWAWGSNNFGQTGIAEGAGKGGSSIIAPRKAPSLAGKNMKLIRGGSHHSIGVTWCGECLVWGRIDGAQSGLDIGQQLPLDDPDKVIVERGRPRILLQPTPLPISGCVYAAAGPDHNIVITSDGKAFSWGFNGNYQCGQGTDDDIPLATLIDNSAVRNKKLSWAGAGGQYSMLASPFE